MLKKVKYSIIAIGNYISFHNLLYTTDYESLLKLEHKNAEAESALAIFKKVL